jgi:hypothetical protein
MGAPAREFDREADVIVDVVRRLDRMSTQAE